MVELSEAAQSIVAAKPNNWKYLLFAQLLLENADLCFSNRQLSEDNSFFSLGTPIGGFGRKSFYEVLSNVLRTLHSEARKTRKDVRKAGEQLGMMGNSRDDNGAIKHARSAAGYVVSRYLPVAILYINLELSDVPRSCQPALRETRRVASGLLDQWLDAYRECAFLVRQEANSRTLGRWDSIELKIELAEPDTSWVYELMRDHVRAYQNARVEPRAREAVARQATLSADRGIGGDIDRMDGAEFERFCARLLVASGYEGVEVTRGSGDQGVDILCEKDRVTYAIQCKRFESMVGNSAVQEVFAGRQLYRRNVGVVMTSGHFTHAARELADATGVALWDREVVLGMVAAARDGGADSLGGLGARRPQG